MILTDLEIIALNLVVESSSLNRFIVDSMPLEVCKESRTSRSKICKENPYATPDIGYCASQQMYYYGYKLHAVCSTNGVFTRFDLSNSNITLEIPYRKINMTPAN